ncbi:helix-turn-helix domain-containing protein [Bacillus timonensis]|nr:helix-turn-helix domain-containing protein [Bacillus timonensis]
MIDHRVEVNGIGKLIKEERRKQQLKQLSLAKGICSVSYLSKIENNLLLPNQEIITLLLKKLNLTIKENQTQSEDEFMLGCHQLYKKAVLYRDKTELNRAVEPFLDTTLKFVNKRHYYTYLLFMFRIKLILHFNKDQVDEDIHYLQSLERNFDEKQQFLFQLNKGLFHYQFTSNHRALPYFETIIQKEKYIALEEWERADFYNILSISYLKNTNFYNAIYYSSKAIQYFKDYHIFNKTIDGYIILNIAQRNLGQYKEAEQNLKLAQSLTVAMGLLNYDGMIHHNFGSLYAAQGKNEMAIESYQLSFEHKKNQQQLENSIATILCIVKEYAKINHSKGVVDWCNTGLKIIQSGNESTRNTYQAYYHHFRIYTSRFTNNEMLPDVLKEAIKYFEKIEQDQYIQKYSILLGDYYFQFKKYKSSSLYYQKANQVLLKQKSIQSWEDL